MRFWRRRGGERWTGKFNCAFKLGDSAYPSKMIRFFDLNGVADRLPEQHRDFAKSIRRWRDSHSVNSELKVAADMIEQALKLCLSDAEGADLQKMALMHAAVMSYARAVERRSSHRGKIAIVGKLDQSQIEMHKHLVHLRDESIGHHGPAGTYKRWHHDRAFLLQEGNTWQPVVVTRMSIFDKAFAIKFHAHLKAVCRIIDAIVEERRADFQKLLDERSSLAEVADVIELCVLTDEEARELRGPVLSGPRTGRTIGYWKDE